MTILTVNKKAFEKRVGKVDAKMEKLITDMGTPVEYVNDSELAVEVFPNRPDLLSLETFSHAVLQYMGKRKVGAVKVHSSEYEVIVDSSVKGVRDYTRCMVVKGLKISEEQLLEIIDLQEKLHLTLGRRRRKVAIGVYPLKPIAFPVRLVGCDPSSVRFVPLDFEKEITGKQVLTQHQTGKEYARLLKGKEKFPFFIDANDNVLSMPPIINSESVGRVGANTKELFVECSGDNPAYLDKVLSIMTLMFSLMGGKIYSVRVTDKKSGSLVTPLLGMREMSFDLSFVNDYLGTSFSEKEVKKMLLRMGIEVVSRKELLVALVPAWRTDVLHAVDLVEDIAIAYGYDNFDPVVPEIATVASEDSISVDKRLVSTILSNLGLIETMGFHLVTKKDVKKTHFDYSDFIDLEDSKTDRDVLRVDLLTNVLQIFASNSDVAYPQRIFELGRVFANDSTVVTGVGEFEHVCVGLIDERISYTDIKQVLDYLMKMLDINFEVREGEHPAYIDGRCGEVFVGNISVGFIGEIAPRVLYNWKIKVPVVAFELDLSFLN